MSTNHYRTSHRENFVNGLIAWFARNSIVGNLLLLVIIAAGGLALSQLNSTILPDVTLDVVTVTVPYRGAAPPEVEESICVLVEEAVQGVEGIKKVTTTAFEGLGLAVVDVRTGYDVDEIRDEIKSSVDGIETFPDDADKPVVRAVPLSVEVISIAIAGSTDLATLKMLAERTREELTSLPEVSQVEIVNVPDSEISIEVSEEALRRWSLTFDDIARSVRQFSVNLPGGSVRTPSGEVLIRTDGLASSAAEFERLPLVTRSDGTRILLGDVARVVDGFENITSETTFDSTPAIVLNVYRVGDESAPEIADAVYAYVERASAELEWR